MPTSDGFGRFLGLRLGRDVTDTSAANVLVLVVEIGGTLYLGNDA